MKEYWCKRCASYRFTITDLEDGYVEAICMICDKAIRFKKVEEIEK